jgi:hypothetical protein
MIESFCSGPLFRCAKFHICPGSNNFGATCHPVVAHGRNVQPTNSCARTWAKSVKWNLAHPNRGSGWHHYSRRAVQSTVELHGCATRLQPLINTYLTKVYLRRYLWISRLWATGASQRTQHQHANDTARRGKSPAASRSKQAIRASRDSVRARGVATTSSTSSSTSGTQSGRRRRTPRRRSLAVALLIHISRRDCHFVHKCRRSVPPPDRPLSK